MEFLKLYSHSATAEEITPDFNKLSSRLFKNVETDALKDTFYECVSECKRAVSFNSGFMLFPVKITDSTIDFKAFSLTSKALSKNLSGCRQCIIFGATAGIGLDRIIDKYSAISPAKAFICQSIGAEYIESYCDFLCTHFEQEQASHTRPRFSPGYSDLSVEVQTKLFELLSLPKNCGLTLTSSLIMRPSKSVTAFVGLSDKACNEYNKCAECERKDCEFKKI